jgi:hypothetical protein
MNSSNKDAVNALLPWLGLQIMPLSIGIERIGPRDVTVLPKASAILPEWWGNGPSSATTRSHRFSAGVSRSKRARKKRSYRAAMAVLEAASTSGGRIGVPAAGSQAYSPHS